MASRLICTRYFYDCTMTFSPGDGTSTSILKEYIKMIYIEKDYEKRIMPIAFIKLNLSPALYSEMVKAEGTGRVYLTLYNYKQESTSSVNKDILRSNFRYYITENPSMENSIDSEVASDNGTAYKSIYIGLIEENLTSSNTKYFEGIYKNTNVSSLISNALAKTRYGSRSILIQALKNNIELEEFACPPQSTVGQFLSYLNSQYNFYNGAYTYFLDYDRTYLRSNDGNPIDDGRDLSNIIAIDIRDLADYQSHVTGQCYDRQQGVYIMYIHNNNADITIDNVSNQLVGSITTVNQNGEASTTGVDTSGITKESDTNGSSVVISSKDPNGSDYYSALISSQVVTLTVFKNEVDTKIFTLNKKYVLSYCQNNRNYKGTYRLLCSKETYIRNGACLSGQILLTLKKIV